MVAVQQHETAEDELRAGQERGAGSDELKRLQGRVNELAREVAAREEAMHVEVAQHRSGSAAAVQVSPQTGEAEAAAAASCVTTAPTPEIEEARPSHAAATPSIDTTKLPVGSAARELLERKQATAPAPTDAEEESDDDDDDDDGIEVMPPVTDFGAFPGRPTNELESVYARAMAGKKVNKHDRIILRQSCELSMAHFEKAMRAREGATCPPTEVVVCLVCYQLLLKPWTLSCGHTLCEECCKRVRKCPLPGATCREAPSFVMLTSAGQVQTQPGLRNGSKNKTVSCEMLHRSELTNY